MKTRYSLVLASLLGACAAPAAEDLASPGKVSTPEASSCSVTLLDGSDEGSREALQTALKGDDFVTVHEPDEQRLVLDFAQQAEVFSPGRLGAFLQGRPVISRLDDESVQGFEPREMVDGVELAMKSLGRGEPSIRVAVLRCGNEVRAVASADLNYRPQNDFDYWNGVWEARRMLPRSGQATRPDDDDAAQQVRGGILIGSLAARDYKSAALLLANLLAPDGVLGGPDAWIHTAFYRGSRAHSVMTRARPAILVPDDSWIAGYGDRIPAEVNWRFIVESQHRAEAGERLGRWASEVEFMPAGG